MWIRTISGWRFIEVEQTSQGMWVPKIDDGKNKTRYKDNTERKG